MPICFHVENEPGPVQWRCNLVAGHEPPHAYNANGIDHHVWNDE